MIDRLLVSIASPAAWKDLMVHVDAGFPIVPVVAEIKRRFREIEMRRRYGSLGAA
jgi:hypothetical protein